MLGIYLHVPFCDDKCPYCDFYSSCGTEEEKDAYVSALCRSLSSWGDTLKNPVDTVYFGGGTPSLLGKRLVTVLQAAKTAFAVAESAEITAECNPRSSSGDLFARLRKGGFNRLSVGVQSFDDAELAFLGRRHTADDARVTLAEAKAAGFRNISLDLMINLPGQTTDTLSRSLAAAVEAAPTHVSVYMLKHEEHTAFSRVPPIDEDEAARQYLFACETLESAGFVQYEISNFARPGFESRHNLKYWHLEDTLGLGPAAHSFINGKRFYYPRDTAAFLRGDKALPDGDGGTEEERVMLGLRLTEGIDASEELLSRASPFLRAGLMERDKNRLRFTREGFLVSNTVLAELI